MNQQMNKAVVRRMIKRLESVPESYDQGAFYIERGSTAPCGTVACLAGEAIICSKPKLAEGIALALRTIDQGGATDLAAQLLGLPRDHDIFSMDASGWPAPFNALYGKAHRSKRAQVAASYLKEALKRGTMIWEDSTHQHAEGGTA